MTFIPHIKRRATTVRPTLREGRDAELRRWTKHRADAMDARWNEKVGISLSLADWRDITLWDAVREAETLHARYAETRDATRNERGMFVTRDGKILYVNDVARNASRDAMLRGIITHRRTLRGLHRATLRDAYRGTTTRDGLAIHPPVKVTRRLEQLERAIALSDTFVTRDGITTAIYARGLRTEAGALDGNANIGVARARLQRGRS